MEEKVRTTNVPINSTKWVIPRTKEQRKKKIL
jgi:hypothetical protein